MKNTILSLSVYGSSHDSNSKSSDEEFPAPLRLQLSRILALHLFSKWVTVPISLFLYHEKDCQDTDARSAKAGQFYEHFKRCHMRLPSFGIALIPALRTASPFS